MTTTNAREIRYDRETRDFALFLDGVLQGWAKSYSEGEAILDGIVYARLTKGAAVEAEENAEAHHERLIELGLAS